ncbi:MAG: lipid A 3-O-deacylase [Flavobacteriaceae bacterium]|jgi:lipid A 3-O-deacylase
MRKVVVLILFASLTTNACIAQRMDNLASFRDVKSAKYFRFHYDNDVIAQTDANYTQGTGFELVAPFFRRNPLNYLFHQPKHAEIRYGLALEHIGFTPKNYELSDIEFGDRPFAAAIMLESFMIAIDTLKRSRFISSISIGFVGPLAFGEQMQVGIHKAIGNQIPLGWRHQIQNDIVINYEIAFEKQLWRFRELFSLQANASAKLGTLFTNGSVGVNLTFGRINSPFSSILKRNGFKLYAYVQPLISVVGYDATLQGGVFNKMSAYTIPNREVERFTGQFNYGIVLKTKSLYFEFTRSVITREFETGTSASWGGLKIGFTL